MGGQRDAGRIPRLHPGVAGRIQLRETVLRPVREQLDQRPDDLLPGQWKTGRGAAHRASRLPDAAGLFRFRSMDEAVRALAAIEADYENQCRLARNLAEEHFDGCRVVTRVLEHALA